MTTDTPTPRERIALAIANQIRADHNLSPCMLSDIRDPRAYLRQADAILNAGVVDLRADAACTIEVSPDIDAALRRAHLASVTVVETPSPGIDLAAKEALELLRELIDGPSSGKFYGIDSTLRSKLHTVVLTLSSALANIGDGGGRE